MAHLERLEQELIGIDDVDAVDCADELDETDDGVKSEDNNFELKPSKPTSSSRDRTPLHCLPLYSMMPSFLQKRVFEPPPVGHR